MKNILLTLTFLFSLILNAQTKIPAIINWMTFEDALAAQKKQPKKIMMDVYTNWCGPCKMLDKNTFQNTNLAAYVNNNFYAVKFNGESKEAIFYDDIEFSNPNYDVKKEFTHNSAHQLADYLKIRAYPSILFFEEDGSLLAPIPGYRTAKQLEVFLKLFKTDKYKEINDAASFSKYQKEFKYKF